MIHPKNYDRHRKNSILLLHDRCVYPQLDHVIRKRFQTHPTCMQRLELEAVLNGHEGCVNCLEWSTDGRILASGSDDFQLCLWDPFKRKLLHTIPTKHFGNMFSVKFLPKYNDAIIATAAADKTIMMFDINHSEEAIFSCHCHTARVKRLATAPDSPYIFWSAGEDGMILQLDHREKHLCQSRDTRTSLINLSKCINTNAEAKCVAVNPVKTELLAVGTNDPYARVYDRRMLKTVPVFFLDTSTTSSTSKDYVTYYCPGHISKDSATLIEPEIRSVSYLTFSPNGTELLVNMGNDHIYLYDILHGEEPIFLKLPEYVPLPLKYGKVNVKKCCPKLPAKIEKYKKLGNELLESEQYLGAINIYSQAIALEANWKVLYLNRAIAYMRRLWFGDVYAALRDCYSALNLDPLYVKAHFRLAKALLELKRPQEADECLKELLRRFPNYHNNFGVLMLTRDIKATRQTLNETQRTSATNNRLKILDEELYLRNKAKDYALRFVGHCNVTTDIKEANFFGYNGDYIVAGSDDGNFFIWDRQSCNIHSVYKGDNAIVNCVLPHPELCMLATSGIDHNIKIWSPLIGTSKPNAITNIEDCVKHNQTKMKRDSFDFRAFDLFCSNG